MKLVVASIALIASPAFADNPRIAKDAAAWCTDQPGEELVFDATGGVVHKSEAVGELERGKRDRMWSTIRFGVNGYD